MKIERAHMPLSTGSDDLSRRGLGLPQGNVALATEWRTAVPRL